jgi:hypothetical protein
MSKENPLNLSWEDLKPYEQQQGGYWYYPSGCDVYGNGKFFVYVPKPEPMSTSRHDPLQQPIPLRDPRCWV